MEQTSKKKTSKPYLPEFRERAVRLANEHRDEYQSETFSAVARRDKITPSRIQQMIGLAFLAPDLLDQIAAGSQPLGLTSEWVKRHDLPLEWQAQRDALALL